MTNEDLAAVKAMHPMEAKKKLAGLLTARFHNEQAAAAARENFEKVFSKKENPDEMPVLQVTAGTLLSAALFQAQAAASKNKARALIEQGAVRINGTKITQDGPFEFQDGDVLQAGKRAFFKLTH